MATLHCDGKDRGKKGLLGTDLLDLWVDPFFADNSHRANTTAKKITVKKMDAPNNSFHAIVRGRVLGAGYRLFALQAAQRHSVAGWVRNLPNGGGVEVYAEAKECQLTAFLTELYKGSVMSCVQDIELVWGKAALECERFEIRPDKRIENPTVAKPVSSPTVSRSSPG